MARPVKHHKHPCSEENKNARWTFKQIKEFCQYYPETCDDIYEFAEYFGRTESSIRNLMIKHSRLVKLGGDPKSFAFAVTMFNIKVTRVLYEEGCDTLLDIARECYKNKKPIK